MMKDVSYRHRHWRLRNVLQIMMKHDFYNALAVSKTSSLYSTQQKRKEQIELQIQSNSMFPKQLISKILDHPRIGHDDVENRIIDCHTFFYMSPNEYMLMIDPLEVLSSFDDAVSATKAMKDSRDIVSCQKLLFEYLAIVQQKWLGEATTCVMKDVFKVIYAKLDKRLAKVECIYAIYTSVKKLFDLLDDSILELVLISLLPVSTFSNAAVASLYERLEISFLQISKALQYLLIWSAHAVSNINRALRNVTDIVQQDRRVTRLPLLVEFTKFNKQQIWPCNADPAILDRSTTAYREFMCTVMAHSYEENCVHKLDFGNKFKFWSFMQNEYHQLYTSRHSSDTDSVRTRAGIAKNITHLQKLYAITLITAQTASFPMQQKTFQVIQQIYETAFLNRENILINNTFDDILIWMKHGMNVEIISNLFHVSQITWHFLDVAANPSAFYAYTFHFTLSLYKVIM
jgi:hypothetical protein